MSKFSTSQPTYILCLSADRRNSLNCIMFVSFCTKIKNKKGQTLSLTLLLIEQ